MEWWNAGPPEADQKDNSHFNVIVNPAGGGTINPTLHYPRTHYSTIPLFHHSICERSELACIGFRCQEGESQNPETESAGGTPETLQKSDL